MSVEIKLEKHPQSDGSIMYSAVVWANNEPVNSTLVASADRAECIEKSRRIYEYSLTVDLEPEWIALEA